MYLVQQQQSIEYALAPPVFDKRHSSDPKPEAPPGDICKVIDASWMTDAHLIVFPRRNGGSCVFCILVSRSAHVAAWFCFVDRS